VGAGVLLGASEDFFGCVKGGGWMVLGFLAATAGFVGFEGWGCLGHGFFLSATSLHGL